MASPVTTELRRGPSPKSMISIGLGLALAIGLIAGVSVLTGGASTTTFSPTVLDGTKLASLKLPGLSSGQVPAPWTQHHPAVVVFFASWCKPCNEELPRVAAWTASHHLGAVRFMGIDSNDLRAPGVAFAHATGLRFASGFDAGGAVTSSVFQITGLPDTVFVNANGVVTHLVIGPVSNRQLNLGVQELNR